MMMIEVPDHLYPALSRMLAMLSAKKDDYAGEDTWSNFRATAEHFEIPIWESADFNEIQKMSRLRILRQGRTPRNEPVADTYLDKACYALLAYAMFLDKR